MRSKKPARKNVSALNASLTAQRCQSAVRLLTRGGTSLGTQPQLQPPQIFNPCSPPDKTPPQFVIRYRRSQPLISLLIPGSNDPDNPVLPIPDFTFGCVKVQPSPGGLEFVLGFDYLFDQTWNVLKLSLGDLSSTISLAPLEQLTLEFQTSQRRTLEQSTVDSAEAMTSTESTTSDKEALNVARSSSKTENWHVDGNGGFNLGIVKLGASAGASGTSTETAQDSIQHVTEATTKSANSLKTLHKIEVRGVTETIIQNRMTRKIRNPYQDRVLALNVFQLIKSFSVSTDLSEIRAGLIAQVNGLVFDADFVLSHSDFLQEKLIDQNLVDDLPNAIQGAKPIFSSGGEVQAQHVARLALRYLFDVPNIFKMPSPLTIPQPLIPPINLGDPNVPDSSFNASPTGQGSLDKSAMRQALEYDLGDVFSTLNVFFKIYREMRDTAVPPGTPSLLEQEDNAIWLATALAAQVKDRWKTAIENPANQSAIQDLFDEADLTEVFRRLTGFLAIEQGRLEGLLSAAADDEKAVLAQADAIFSLNRLLKHLRCNENYYTQQFLAYIAIKTDNQTIVDFMNQLIDSTGRFSTSLPDLLRSAFDVERSFVSKQAVITPGIRALTDSEVSRFGNQLSGSESNDFNSGDITTSVVNIEVPCDGIHLEAAPGLCVLPNVPSQASNTLDLEVQGASLKVGTP